MEKIPQDIIGNIAVLKFPYGTKSAEKKRQAMKFLKLHKNVKTVLEKTGKFSGRLRKLQTKFLAGIKTKQAVYRENDCKFIFDVDETYFSPRMSSHRKDICEEVAANLKNNSKVLVMFAGVAPWPIVLARTLKLKYGKKKVKIISNELNKKANVFALQNIRLNNVEDYVSVLGGDAMKLPSKLKEKFDVIMMLRPNLKETFLSSALKLAKKGTTIYYHGFGLKEEVLDEIKRDAGSRIGKIRIEKAGEIAPYKFRWMCRFGVV